MSAVITVLRLYADLGVRIARRQPRLLPHRLTAMTWSRIDLLTVTRGCRCDRRPSPRRSEDLVAVGMVEVPVRVGKRQGCSPSGFAILSLISPIWAPRPQSTIAPFCFPAITMTLPPAPPKTWTTGLLSLAWSGVDA